MICDTFSLLLVIINNQYHFYHISSPLPGSMMKILEEDISSLPTLDDLGEFGDGKSVGDQSQLDEVCIWRGVDVEVDCG